MTLYVDCRPPVRLRFCREILTDAGSVVADRLAPTCLVRVLYSMRRLGGYTYFYCVKISMEEFFRLDYLADLFQIQKFFRCLRKSQVCCVAKLNSSRREIYDNLTIKFNPDQWSGFFILRIKKAVCLASYIQPMNDIYKLSKERLFLQTKKT